MKSSQKKKKERRKKGNLANRQPGHTVSSSSFKTVPLAQEGKTTYSKGDSMRPTAGNKELNKELTHTKHKRAKKGWDVHVKQITESGSGVRTKSQTERTVNTSEGIQGSNTKMTDKKSQIRRKRFRKAKSESIPAEPVVKVHTHAALYKNPETFSSNWKELMKELVGKKEQTKRKAESQKGQPSKKRKKKENVKPSDGMIAEKSTVEKPDIWFDDVDEDLLELSESKPSPEKTKKEKSKVCDTKENIRDSKVIVQKEIANPLVKERAVEGLTKAVAMDCEMVGVGQGGKDSILARVSIVNQYGKCIYDKYVKPREHVTDFRTQFSGIRPENLKNAEDFTQVQKDVYDVIKGRILVGHAIHNDLKVLYLDHPRKKIRDTARYRAFRKIFQGKTPSLKKLTGRVLNVKVQEGEHNSVEDAQAAMRLYTMYKVQWEKEIKLKHMKTNLSKSSDTTETDL